MDLHEVSEPSMLPPDHDMELVQFVHGITSKANYTTSPVSN